ncbi:hypothetical protein G4Z16_01405 [Streptomyces bathyalis]|uniref:NB-ARC domain-containing protein n=1 Tax=Streptomyces bathyalis TaxID=2710756 RepID=A0A7T1WQT1_9ACTN|nr:NB-ARC domain-containing protein [Streptomyces bathyalis]QPP05262.1 hypothetical protein G4Z16_01405 [Streptomyces bathyalis]
MKDAAGTRNDLSGTVYGNVIQANSVSVSHEREARRGAVWMVPTPTQVLVARVDLTERLAELLSPGGADVGVVGNGGFGKTTLSAQVCHRVRHMFPGGVLWVTLGENVSEPVLADKINDLSELLIGQRPALTDPRMAGYRLGELLRDREPTLLVIDDLWAASRLAPFPTGPNVARLVTSRMRGTLPMTCEILKIGQMSLSESGSMLSNGLPGLTCIEGLTRLTGGWALLLSLVNGAIREYVEEGATPDEAADLIEQQLVQDGPDSLDLESADRRDQAVAATVEASLRRLASDDRNRFAELGVFPEDIAVPVEVVGSLWAANALSAARIRRLIRQLADLSLVSLSDGAIRIHDVLRTYLRRLLGPCGLIELNATLVNALRAADPAEWASASPYTRKYLAGHAASAGLLDPLLLDAGFLLAASQPDLLACLDAARGDDAQTAAAAYRRAAHHLRDRRMADRPAYLALAARRLGATELAYASDERGQLASWSSSWALWNSEPEHTTLARHRSAVLNVSVASLSNGRTWAVSNDIDGETRVVDVVSNESVELPGLLPNHGVLGTRCVQCVRLPHGGHLMFAHAWGEGLRIWDPVSGDAVAFEDQETVTKPAEIVWTEDQSRLVVLVADWEKTIRAWDGTTGRLVGEKVNFKVGGGTNFWTIAAGSLPNGHVAVAIANESQPVQLWDIETGQQLPHTLPGDPRRTMHLAWGKNALFTGGDSGLIRRWEPATGRAAGSDLAGHDTPLSALICAPTSDGEVVISGDDSGKVRVWDALTGDCREGPLTAHPDSVRSLAYAELPDGRAVVMTGGNENTARLWEMRAFGSESDRATGLPAPTSAVVAGNLVVSGHRDGTLRVWTPREQIAELEPGYKVLTCHDGFVIATPGRGLWVRTLTSEGKANPARRLPATGWVACATKVDDTTVAIIGGDENVVEAVRLPDGRRLWRKRTRERTKWEHRSAWRRPGVSAITTATLTDGRRVVVTGGTDGTIRIWDLANGRRVGTSMNCRDAHQLSPASVTALVGTRLLDGRAVAIAGSEDTTSATVAVWDLATCRMIAATATPTGWISHAVCTTTPDGSPVLVTGGKVLQVWRLDALDPATDWLPAFDIDLDAPVTALTTTASTLIAGTQHGMARLQLR